MDCVFHSDLDLPIKDRISRLITAGTVNRSSFGLLSAKIYRTCNAQPGPPMYQGQIVNAVQRSQNTDTQEGGHLEVEAEIGISLDKIVRYQSVLKRDLYRAIEMRREL